MNLTTLTHPGAVCVKGHYGSRDEAIRQLTMRLLELGKITDGDEFWQKSSVGNRLALPHWGKGWRYHMANRPW